MMSTRAIAAVIGVATVVGAAALTTAAVTDDDAPDRTAAGRRTDYVEPSAADVPDGTYVGYVRTTGDDRSLAVDFVSLDGGRAQNTQPEVLVDAGLLDDVDIFDELGKPFRLVIDDGTVIEVQSTDDIPDYADRDGDDGERVDVAEWLAEHPTVAEAVADLAVIGGGDGRVDIGAWLAEHDTVSDTEWWNLERRVLRALIEDIRKP